MELLHTDVSPSPRPSSLSGRKCPQVRAQKQSVEKQLKLEHSAPRHGPHGLARVPSLPCPARQSQGTGAAEGWNSGHSGEKVTTN